MRALLLCVLAGCALTRNAPPLEVRYFSPEDSVRTPPDGDAASCARVRTGRIVASAHLRYRMVRRTASTELELLDARRWTEVPAAYVRRSLGTALFVEQPLTEAVDASAPTLDVEVIAFEEVITPRARTGRVQLAYHLRDEDTVRASGVVTVTRPAAGVGVDAAVAAISSAMHAATSEVAARVVRVICAR